jgi:4-alpha-glucanotransferase
MGEQSRRFIDFLKLAGQSIWQVLPLGPTAYGNSPYSCYSAFAGNPLLIDLEQLITEGDLTPGEGESTFPECYVDFERVHFWKLDMLAKGAMRFFASADQQRLTEFWRFCDDNNWWLHDYALFMALKTHFHGTSWCEWPMDLVYREMGALARYSEQLGPQIGIHKYQQWQFFRQWQVVKGYANDNGIAIFGDIPIFVAHDSVDVWANQHLFQLDETGKPTVVAGVPPDYFSKTGQLWGNPLYRWDAMALDGYGWWVARMRSACDLYDMLRIDHFRGFEAYWEVPATERTAVKGRWVKGPGEALFRAFLGALGRLPVVAEDLGVITPEVEELRDRFDLPGMKILQFAFGSGSDNPYLPHNHIRNSVVYTGTHDNDTTVGWFDAIKPKERKHIGYYLDVATLDMPWDLIRSAMASVADTAIIPLQDILGLGSEARMNLPGSATGNWSWRFGAKELNKSTASKLRKITQLYGRCKTST